MHIDFQGPRQGTQIARLPGARPVVPSAAGSCARGMTRMSLGGRSDPRGHRDRVPGDYTQQSAMTRRE